MLIAERRRRIFDQVQVRGYASYRELAEALGTSESTVRRDLRSMVDEGLLLTTRGGVGLPEGLAFAPGSALPVVQADRSGPVQARSARPGPRGADRVEEAREAIADLAAAMVEPGTGVILGPGRTTAAIARRLVRVRDLTVVTNSLAVVQALVDAPDVDVFMVGGALRRSIQAFVGPITEQTVGGLRAAQVFLSGDGLTVERGLTTPNVFAAATDQALMMAARTVVVLADHTKVGHDTMCPTVPTDRIDILITDRDADQTELRRLAAAAVDVRVAAMPTRTETI